MADSMRSISIIFNSKKDRNSGQWVDTLTAKTEMDDISSDEMKVDVKQNVELKDGRRIITLNIMCNGRSVVSTNDNEENEEISKDVENFNMRHQGGDGIDIEQRVSTVQSDEFVNNEGTKQNSNSFEKTVRGKDTDMETMDANAENIEETQTDVKLLETNTRSVEVQTEKTTRPDVKSVDMSVQTDVKGQVEPVNELKFHQRCGYNVKIENDGKSVHSLKKDPCNTTVFTNRQLKSGEIFQIMIDKIWNKGSSIKIGVINESPNKCEIDYTYMYKSKCAWSYNGAKSIYINGKKTNSNYVKETKINVADTFGVMRDEFGDLYFYINGEKQDLAAKGVPSNIYGFVELYYAASIISIIGP